MHNVRSENVLGELDNLPVAEGGSSSGLIPVSMML